jgi:hypothetical protein
VALRVFEELENPSGAQTNGRYFRRSFRQGGKHPLNTSITRAIEENVPFEWAVESCDICGDSVFDVEEELIAVVADEEGIPVWGGGGLRLTGRTALVCAPCSKEYQL